MKYEKQSHPKQDGAGIRNKGEVDLVGVSEKGTPTKFTTQVGEGVKRLLVSVRNAAKGGNIVIFGANMKAIRELAKQSTTEENLIMDTKTGVKNEIQNTRGIYVYPMMIRRKNKKDPNTMEIGSAEVKGRFESDNVFGGFKEDDSEDKDISSWKVF